MSAEQSVTVRLDGRTYYAFFTNGKLRSVLMESPNKVTGTVTRTLYASEWNKPLKGRPLQVYLIAEQRLRSAG